MNEGLSRKVSVTPKCQPHKSFAMYSKRLVKDLEAKGITRTVVESVNLSLHADHENATRAECIRAMPTVTFPAPLLLQREEIETKKVAGVSVIIALHHSLRWSSSTASVAEHTTSTCFLLTK